MNDQPSFEDRNIDGSAEPTDDPIDQMGRRAAAELRRSAPADGLARIRQTRRRRRATQAVASGVVGVTVVGLAAFVVTRDDEGTITTDRSTTTVGVTVPTSTFAATTLAPTTNPSITQAEETDADPTTTVMPTTTVASSSVLPDPAPIAPTQVGPGTEFVVGGGAVLGAYTDDGFVPYDRERFSAPSINTWPQSLGVAEPVTLFDRTGSGYEFLPFDEGCGAIVVLSTDGSPAPVARGVLATQTIGTADGRGEADLTALEAALTGFDLAAGTLDLITPTVSIDQDPSLETLVMLFEADLAVVDNMIWLAVWDPDTNELTSIAGDPAAQAPRFDLSWDGPADIDGDGTIDAPIATGTTVELVRLSDGTRIATAERCPISLEVSIEFTGLSATTPIPVTVRTATGDVEYPLQVTADNNSFGPLTFDFALRGVTGTDVLVDTPSGTHEFETLFGPGRNDISITIDPTVAPTGR